MKKIINFIFISSFLLLWTNCQSPSADIKDAFQKVNNSITVSNSVLGNSIDEIYNSIGRKRSINDTLALKADIIYITTKHATNFIDSIKEVLNQADPTGDNINLSYVYLIRTKSADSLRALLSGVYSVNISYYINDSTKKSRDSSLLSISDVLSDKTWTKVYFEKSPTVAAMTILSKFKNDCINASKFTLSDIDMKLVK